jgi:hypothetical protein
MDNLRDVGDNYQVIESLPTTSGEFPMIFRNRQRRLQARFDWLESRELLALVTFTVTNTEDFPYGIAPGSLREAIANIANYNNTSGSPVNFEIDFDIPGSGVQTINALLPLPTVPANTFINGDSQPGYAGTPLIEINGSQVEAYRSPGYYSEGLIVKGGEIDGIAIDRFAGDELLVTGPELVQGNDIGITPSSDLLYGGGQAGISVLGAGADGSTIGGTAAGQANIISANYWGIYTFAVDDLSIAGNIIGLDPTGTKNYGNFFAGIEIQSTDPLSGVKGTGDTVSGNVICGSIYGFYLSTAVGGTHDSGDTVTGNTFGQNLSSVSFPNTKYDLFIDANADGNTVSGNTFTPVSGTAGSPVVRDINPYNTYSGNVGFDPTQHGVDVGVTTSYQDTLSPNNMLEGFYANFTVTNQGSSTATNIVIEVDETGIPNFEFNGEEIPIDASFVVVPFANQSGYPGYLIMIPSLAAGQTLDGLTMIFDGGNSANTFTGNLAVTVESDGIDPDLADKHTTVF